MRRTLDRAALGALLPHAGAMCLLDRVLSWDAERIACAAVSHLDPANPLRRAGVLPVLSGLEYPLQAAALHGALTSGSAVGPGWVATLRDVVLHADRLDEPALGELRAGATLEHGDPNGALYGLTLDAADGRPLLAGRALIAFGP